MKKNFIKIIYVFVIAFSLIGNLYSEEKCFNELNFDDIEIDLDLLDNIEKPTKSLEDIFDKLIPVIQNIEAPLWNKTKPPRGRDVLYLMPHRITALEYGGFNLNLFFNYTNKMDFSINEVLKLDENQAAMDEFVDVLVQELDSEEASSLIPLFKKLTIQERKLGVLGQFGFVIGSFRTELDTSLQFSERNFWLNQKDQDRIKQMFATANSSFDNKELYKTKFGMGDTRLKLGLNSLNTSSFQVDVGFEGIFPTSNISTDRRLKYYNINLDNFEDDIPKVLDNIRNNLIEPQLGNYGHYGLGCYMETKIDMFHNALHLWTRASFDNLFAANEDRLIPSIQTIPTPVDLARLYSDPEYATEFIKEYIFPPAYRVKIRPGDIINFVTTLSFELGRRWSFAFGYDFYCQQKEIFEQIYTNEDINTLKIDAAQSPSATQHKLFAEVTYKQKQKGWDLLVGCGGDYTISSRNLGHDWTLFVRAGASF